MTRSNQRDSHLSPSLVLSTAAKLVPQSRRAEWLQDWTAELWYVQDRAQSHSSQPSRDALRFCMGAFNDAIWIRGDSLKTEFRQALWLQTPLRCLLILAGITAPLCSGVFYDPWLLMGLVRQPGFIPAQVLGLFMALLILPLTTSLAFAEYTAASRSQTRRIRLRRWFFLSLKLSLTMTIAFCVCFYLSQLPGGIIFCADGFVAAYVLAIRWTLIDQRRRCPICLHLLTASSAAIGQRSRIFLESCARDYCCPKGHGSLYVPDVATSFARRRWRELSLK